MTAPERFADSQIPLAPRAPSIHDPSATLPGRPAWFCDLLGGAAVAYPFAARASNLIYIIERKEKDDEWGFWF